MAELAKAILVTPDSAFSGEVKAIFDAAGCMVLDVIPENIHNIDIKALKSASVVVVDIDTSLKSDLSALQNLMNRTGARIPVIVMTPSFEEAVARWLIQIKITDFLKKPIDPIEILRSCLKALSTPAMEVSNEARIFTFLPAAGGVGVTTLAVQTAHLMAAQSRKQGARTCIVDLDFQHGSTADYLDIEPRLDLHEIESQPDRLDPHLLQMMLSSHQSGLHVLAAPGKPAQMQTLDPLLVTRILDLVAMEFDNVIIDLPRTWFPWTDNVLAGSNDLFVVTEMTVPGLRHAHRMSTALKERLGQGVTPKVIVNRFEERLFGGGLKRADFENVLGDRLAGVIPNHYAMVREAIDRGIPLTDIKADNAISKELWRLVRPQNSPKEQGKSLLKKLMTIGQR